MAKKRKKLPIRTIPVVTGWIVKARLITKKRQWYEKEKQTRDIEVTLTKTLSERYSSREAAQIYCDLATKTGKYLNVWVTESYGEEEDHSPIRIA